MTSNVEKPKPKPKKMCKTCHVNECMIGWTICEPCWEKKFRPKKASGK